MKTLLCLIALSLCDAEGVKPIPSLRSIQARPTEQVAAVTPAAAPRQPISVNQGRVLVLCAGCIWGTYAVLLRAINSGDSMPLPIVFVTAARYQFLCLFAFLQKKYLASRHSSLASATTGKRAPNVPSASRTLAAIELAAITVCSTLLSIWGVSRVPSVTSEILSSTVHIFVPILTLMASASLASKDFGLLTWVGCLVSFIAALGVAIASATTTGPVPPAPIIAQLAVVGSALVLALQRVRAQTHLRTHSASMLNTERMLWMGYLSLGLVVLDALRGGPSAATLLEITKIAPKQWALMALSVFLSAFVASALQYEAQAVIPAANAQPFLALQPIFSAVWARLLLGETITAPAMIGGCMQIGGAVIASKDDTVQRERASEGDRRKKGNSSMDKD